MLGKLVSPWLLGSGKGHPRAWAPRPSHAHLPTKAEATRPRLHKPDATPTRSGETPPPTSGWSLSAAPRTRGRGARVSLHSEARWECGHCRIFQKVPHKENNRPFPQRLPWALRGFPPLFPFPQTPRTVSPLGRRTPPANEERGPERCRGLLQGHPQVWSHLSGPEAGGGRAIRAAARAPGGHTRQRGSHVRPASPGLHSGSGRRGPGQSRSGDSASVGTPRALCHLANLRSIGS